MLAIGLMSGTSLDGIDAALIETDGEALVRPVAFLTERYSEKARETLREAARIALAADQPVRNPEIAAAETMLTRRHAMLVHQLLRQTGIAPEAIGVIGFHGQTVAHRPDRGWTWQIGDGGMLSRATGIPVVDDFRSADVAAGGQGAPLLPVYHRALAEALEKPLAILNLGGVGNLTFIGRDGAMVAFDTGPANALVDDWMMEESGQPFDENGALAATGRVDEAVLGQMLDHPFFDAPPPKSLDRADFTIAPARGLTAADGATTLSAFTAASVALGLRLLPERPARIYVAGGGRHNATLMTMIAGACDVALEPIEAIGARGDATEAEGFAYMAVRRLRGLPISFPGTTGVPAPITGGTVHEVRR